MLDPKYCNEADALANQFFSDFLDIYRPYGINETSAVNWEEASSPICQYFSYFGSSGPIGYVYSLPIERSHSEKAQLATVCKDSPHFCPQYCWPDSLTAIHELMHVEEYHHSNPNPSHLGKEIMTVTRDFINVDRIYKKIHNVNLTSEVDYSGKRFEINSLFKSCLIPLGKYINFYRELEKTKANLAEAIVSQESIEFLTCIGQENG